MPTPPGDNSFFKDNSFQYDDSVSWVKGKHNWKFGGVYRRQGFDATYNSNAAPQFGFTNALTSAGNLAKRQPHRSELRVRRGILLSRRSIHRERWRRSKRCHARPRLGLLRPG